MNLIRVVGRMLLGGYFVAQGAKSVANPQPLLDRAEPLAERFVPRIKEAAPEQVAPFIPTDPTTLVRLNGAMQVVGGLGLATGIGRRLGAMLVALAIIPHAIASRPGPGASAELREQGRKDLLKNAALLGGALLASQDLAGKPSMSWRAGQVKRQFESSAEDLSKKAKRRAAKLEKRAKKQADKLGKRAGEVLSH